MRAFLWRLYYKIELVIELILLQARIRHFLFHMYVELYPRLNMVWHAPSALPRRRPWGWGRGRKLRKVVTVIPYIACEKKINPIRITKRNSSF